MRQVDWPKEEEDILKFWEENKVFEKTLEATKKGRPFVFFEGPPTANARPGIHHVLARAFKDIILRYQTMRGRFVARRAGWDTHGLPVEIEVEKKLGLKNKKDIEKYGVAKFNRQCRQSVWQYKDEWEKLTRRMGFWLDLKDYYATYEPAYIESLWAVIKKIWDKKLLVKDYKVVPLCLRCGTPVSSHEVAQGYETATDRAVTVKFKVKGLKNTYLLAWTTTPWTLPGNVALAVGPKIVYQEVAVGTERYILAKDLVPKVLAGLDYKVVKDMSAPELTKLAYEPLFKIKQLASPKSYKVYQSGFVNTESGTGIVHTAVMYGVDDFDLGAKIGLPKFHTVNPQGAFIKSVPVVGGLSIISQGQKDLTTEKAILFYLKKQNLLFKEQPYSHEYPFCWRCHSPLLYYALETWFIKMSRLRNELIANNKRIGWVPEHIKEGRFGEWLREVKDWAFSRERYWGTPLPVWECQKCQNQTAAGSLGDLSKQRFYPATTLVLMRHGQAESNVKAVCSCWPEPGLNPLTELGRRQVTAAAKKLKSARLKIDAIYSSDLLRARETAAIAAEVLGLKNVVYDPRLREINMGVFNGQPVSDYHNFFKSFKERFTKTPPQGESWLDVYNRVKDFVKDVSGRHIGKKILVISHMDPLFIMAQWGSVFEDEAKADLYRLSVKNIKNVLGMAEFKEFELPNNPVDEEGDLDLHRPYADEIYLKCPRCSSKMERVKEVIDVWFDSGAMPWAQWHWPFAPSSKFQVPSSKLPKNLFPADYICEAVDQTRGWFYTLLAVSTLLDQGAPYKNAISLNHVLDEKGEKMSKSKGNTVDPWLAAEKVGFDTLRWYFFSVNGPGDNKFFSLRDVEVKQRRFISTLINSLLFLETYWVKSSSKLQAPSSKLGVLDKWILSRLENVRAMVSESLNSYDVTTASRALEDFVEDLSNWYIRRSRRRFQKSNVDADKLSAQNTLLGVLKSTAVLLAPFTPFLAEFIWQHLRGLTQIYTRINAEEKHQPSAVSIDSDLRAISVHLAKWPVKLAGRDAAVEKIMTQARSLVALGLAERARAGLKVRQPLGLLNVSPADYGAIEPVVDIVAEELNVKKILADKGLPRGIIGLDTNLSPVLVEEGLVRELARQINDMRKEAGLTPDDRIVLFYDIHQGYDFQELLGRWEKTLAVETRAKEIHFGIRPDQSFLIKKIWSQGGVEISLGIMKV
ncbi:MAG: class I tRNA ligase family protein [Parcubacteria group bacterium]|nr:class I tRNA ligase family protein [Parcubacteria group bacterium]